MKCKEVAAELLKTPDAELFAKVGDDWAEVFGVIPTGDHRNAMTLKVLKELPGGKTGIVLAKEPE